MTRLNTNELIFNCRLFTVMKQKRPRPKEHFSPCPLCLSGATSILCQRLGEGREESKTALTVPQLVGSKEQSEYYRKDEVEHTCTMSQWTAYKRNFVFVFNCQDVTF